MKQLLVDSASNEQIIIGLLIDGRTFTKKQKVKLRGGVQVILPLIDKLFKEQKVDLKDLESIIVNTKQGSFTGVRVGMSIANALSFSLDIPVFEKEFDSGILKE